MRHMARVPEFSGADHLRDAIAMLDPGVLVVLRLGLVVVFDSLGLGAPLAVAFIFDDRVRRSRIAVPRHADRGTTDQRLIADLAHRRPVNMPVGHDLGGCPAEMLLDLFVSGGISLTSLTDDYYIFDAKHHRLTGRRTGRSFQIGDLLTVGLLDVDLRRNRIYFAPVMPQKSGT